MNSNGVMDFDSLVAAEVPVKFGGKEYLLCEASEGAACIYRNALLACARFGADGKPSGVTNLADVEPLLVSLCLVELGGSEGGRKPVAITKIKAWPARVVKRLFERAKELSDLNEGQPKEREQLEKALATEGSPVSLDTLRGFLDGLPESDFKELRNWLQPTPEEAAKNAPAATGASSV